MLKVILRHVRQAVESAKLREEMSKVFRAKYWFIFESKVLLIWCLRYAKKSKIPIKTSNIGIAESEQSSILKEAPNMHLNHNPLHVGNLN